MGGLFRNVLLGLATLWSAACVTVDHNAAASLGTAGMQATQILSSQASGAIQTLGELNQWWAVHDTLVCLSAKADLQQGCADGAAKERPDPSRQKLIGVLNKRKQAIDTLNQAYSAFVDLAHYNAGQEATSALNTTFTDINGFLSAVTAISGGTVPAISSTVGKVTAGVVGLVADNRQNAQILAANKDLATANEALSKGLGEEVKVMSNILKDLETEREALYKAGFDAGLINPVDVLTPVFAQAYPGVQLQSPPRANLNVVKTSASIVISLQNQHTRATIDSSYRKALLTLTELKAQHDKLDNKRTVDIGAIEREISNLKTDVAQMTPPSSLPAKK